MDSLSVYIHIVISDIKPLIAAMETQQWILFFSVYIHIVISDIKPLIAAMETQQWIIFFFCLRTYSNK